MKIKQATCAAATLIIIFCCCSAASSYGAETPQQQLVRNFYAWYSKEILAEVSKAPVFDDAMFTYVSPCTVKRLRIDYERDFIGADYFLQANDFWPEQFENMVVQEPIPVTKTVDIVPVGLGGAGKDGHFLLVFVEKENASYRIIKVEDTN